MRRIQEILKAGKGGRPWMSQFEVLERLFLGASAEAVLYMGISEVRGYLEVMEKEGLAAVSLDGARRLYRLNNPKYTPREEK
jgi:hypothetical protein